ncbi:MAG: phage antirepressor KilAC domain-containing protein, partial [Oscillospiraceae bacterium]|nr:phage antirepressor KilAC domain-containing protein [Oscillospiraceae bacterium]
NPDLAIRAFTALKEEREKRKALEAKTAEQAQLIREMQPKATYYDIVLNCKDLVTVNTIAKDYGKSAVWLNKWLYEHGIQYKQGKMWHLYQRYAEKGYTQSKTYAIPSELADAHAKALICWTPKGRLFIYEQLKANGILPMIEREGAGGDEA